MAKIVISPDLQRLVARTRTRPLNDKEWERLMRNLRRGPTKKQREIMAEAERVVKQLEKRSRDCSRT